MKLYEHDLEKQYIDDKSTRNYEYFKTEMNTAIEAEANESSRTVLQAVLTRGQSYIGMMQALAAKIAQEINPSKKNMLRMTKGWNEFIHHRRNRIIMAVVFAFPVAVSSAVFFWFSGKHFLFGIDPGGGIAGLLHHPSFLAQIPPNFHVIFATVLAVIGGSAAFCLYVSSVNNMLAVTPPQVGYKKSFLQKHPMIMVVLPSLVAVLSLGLQLLHLTTPNFWTLFFPIILIILGGCLFSRFALFSGTYHQLCHAVKEASRPCKAKYLGQTGEQVPSIFPHEDPPLASVSGSTLGR
jgi:hypothetical protein